MSMKTKTEGNRVYFESEAIAEAAKRGDHDELDRLEREGHLDPVELRAGMLQTVPDEAQEKIVTSFGAWVLKRAREIKSQEALV